MRLTTTAACAAACLATALAAPAFAATYTYAGSIGLPGAPASDPAIGGAFAPDATPVVSFSATFSDVASVVRPDSRSYFAAAYSVAIDGVEIFSEATTDSYAYIDLATFDAGDPQFNADIIFFQLYAPKLGGFAAFPVDLLVHMRFGATFGAFGSDFALPTDTGFLAAERPGDPPITMLLANASRGAAYAQRTNYALADDFTITAATGATVPEPASWALLLMGFAMGGGYLRAARRQRLAA